MCAHTSADLDKIKKPEAEVSVILPLDLDEESTIYPPALHAISIVLVPVTSLIYVSHLIGGSGVISVISTNQVSNSQTLQPVQSYRWEPSSADTGGWINSYHDIGTVRGNPNANVTHAFTSVWSGASWSAAAEHRTPSNVTPGNLPLIDTYTYWDSFRSKYLLAAVDYGAPGNSVWVQYASDSSGLGWQPMTKAIAGDLAGPVQWDFPSIAVDANTGRIVVGGSKIVGQVNSGYWTSYSTDGGITWNGPYSVNGTSGGATSRITWSSTGFHAVIQDTADPQACTYNQNGCVVLQHWTSPDGQMWAQQLSVATYGVPLLSSSTNVISASPAGALSYASVPDAVSSPGLGWVVAYPVNIAGLNAINVSTELSGGITITYSNDLFSHGIATSAGGDWYLTYQTYQNPGGSPIYLQQGVVYRTSSGSFMGATIYNNIDPSQWWYYNSSAGRCLPSASACYAAGDWFRPAMNSFTGASVPMILGSSNLNDLYQIFISDPQTPNVPQFLPRIEPFVNGSDISSRAVLTTAHLQHIALGHYKFKLGIPGL